MKKVMGIAAIFFLIAITSAHAAFKRSDLIVKCTDGQVKVSEEILRKFDFFEGLCQTYGSLKAFLDLCKVERGLDKKVGLTIGIVSCRADQHGFYVIKVGCSLWLFKMLIEFVKKEGEMDRFMELFFEKLTPYELRKLLLLVDTLCLEDTLRQKLLAFLVPLTTKHPFKDRFLKGDSELFAIMGLLDKLCWRPHVALRPTGTFSLRRSSRYPSHIFDSKFRTAREQDDCVVFKWLGRSEQLVTRLEDPYGQLRVFDVAVDLKDPLVLFQRNRWEGVVVMRASSQEVFYLVSRQGYVQVAQLSSDGSTVLIIDGFFDNTAMRVIDLDTKKLLLKERIRLSDYGLSSAPVALSSDGALLAIAEGYKIVIKEIKTNYKLFEVFVRTEVNMPVAWLGFFKNDTRLVFKTFFTGDSLVQRSVLGVYKIPTTHTWIPYSGTYLINCLEKTKRPLALSGAVISLYQGLPQEIKEAYKNKILPELLPIKNALKCERFLTA